MAELSQRTVIRLATFLEALTQRKEPAIGLILMSYRNLRDRLYERGISDGMMDFFVSQYKWNFRSFLIGLYEGGAMLAWDEASGAAYSVCSRFGPPSERGRQLILQMAEVAVAFAHSLQPSTFPHHDLGRELTASIEMDGFVFVSDKLVPAASAVFNQPKQASLLKMMLCNSGLANRETALHHYENGEDAYVRQNWDTAIGEWRKFFEAVVRGVAEATADGRPDLGKDGLALSKYRMADVFEYVAKAGFLNADEKVAVGAVWGFLSSGNHPGVGNQLAAQCAMTLALSFGQVLLSKQETWVTSGYRHF